MGLPEEILQPHRLCCTSALAADTSHPLQPFPFRGTFRADGSLAAPTLPLSPSHIT